MCEKQKVSTAACSKIWHTENEWPWEYFMLREVCVCVCEEADFLGLFSCWPAALMQQQLFLSESQSMTRRSEVRGQLLLWGAHTVCVTDSCRGEDGGADQLFEASQTQRKWPVNQGCWFESHRSPWAETRQWMKRWEVRGQSITEDKNKPAKDSERPTWGGPHTHPRLWSYGQESFSDRTSST